MGLLKVGKPYSWDEAREHRQYVRHHGVVQFLNIYNRVKDITNDELLWGDEVRGAAPVSVGDVGHASFSRSATLSS